MPGPVVVAIAALVAAGGAPADARDARRWTAGDTALELTYLAVQTVDWMQTRHFLREGSTEANPILGERPTRGTLVAYNFAAMTLHAAVAYVLPRPWRTVWQCVWIGAEAWTIGGNVRTHGALHVSFP